MAIRLDGKVAALSMKENLTEQFSKLDRKACLCIIHFNDPASASYLKGRIKIADEVGVSIRQYPIDDTYDQSKLIALIHDLNEDNTVDGIMIDRPLPKCFNENEVLSEIKESKDVDGYTSSNLGRMLANKDCFSCATPGGAMRLAQYYNIDMTGKNVLVIGRSVNVGKPLALMALNANATVTIAHSKTKNIHELCQKADIIFLAIGKAGFLKKEDVNSNTTVIDIGINFDEQGKLCGDASKDIADVCYAYSPVPGGVGVLTNVVLMENLLKAYQSK